MSRSSGEESGLILRFFLNGCVDRVPTGDLAYPTGARPSAAVLLAPPERTGLTQQASVFTPVRIVGVGAGFKPARSFGLSGFPVVFAGGLTVYMRGAM